MGLDYSQKRLLSKTFRKHKKGSGRHSALSSARRNNKDWKENLEVYAFWAGLMSTFISLLQVIIIAIKK